MLSTKPLAAFAFCAIAASALAQSLPQVTISAQANRDPVEKSYRKMVRGMDLFERQRASYSPDGVLRFKLLPRKRDTTLDGIAIDVIGTATEFPVEVAPDKTFALPRNRKAYDEDAQVTPNRKAMSMTWRTEIRTPGLPANTRRLGDLRLECHVGLEAGVVSNSRSVVGRMADAVSDLLGYCDREDARYLYFADRPIFSVTLVSGARREVLSIEKLYASASDDANLANDLLYCDCEVLLDRTYFLPLGDRTWPNDTLVVFDYMDD